jgi:hypothetical protein
MGIVVDGVGADLGLMDVAASGAPQGPVLETGTSGGNALNLHARLAYETTRPLGRARRRNRCLWIGQQMPPMGSGGSATELSVTANCHGRTVMRHPAPVAGQDTGQYCSLQKIQIRASVPASIDRQERLMGERLAAMEVASAPATSPDQRPQLAPVLRPFLWPLWRKPCPHRELRIRVRSAARCTARASPRPPRHRSSATARRSRPSPAPP